MTNDEARMTKEALNPNDELRCANNSIFVIRHSFVIRASSLVIFARCVLLCLVAVLGFGCATSERRTGLANPSPKNVFRFSAKLRRDLRRVAVLPISAEAGNLQAQAGRTE